MNKTISINLGGIFFHIDEDAYQKLSRYLDAVKRSLSPDGKDEIISDIEARIAELFQEKIASEKQVITLSEIDGVIAVMGQPEDYKIEDDSNNYTNTSYSTAYSQTTETKKLYRDEENSLIGGVLSGLGHYLRVDPLWLRIAMVILLFGYGTGFLVYLLFWILVPAAKTTSQKLEMRGEPINLSNIEKKVREGISDISGKISNIDGEKIANGARNGAEKISSSLGSVFITIFTICAKILGVFIIIFAGSALIGIVIGSVMMLFSSTLPDAFVFNNLDAPFTYIETPFWIQGLLLLFSIGIPLLFLLILGLKLVVTNMRSTGSYFKFSMLAIWIVSIIIIVFLTIQQTSIIGSEGKIVTKEQIMLQPTDTLYIDMKFNNYFSKNVNKRVDKEVRHDSKNNEIIYSNDVKIHLMHTKEAQPYVQIEKTAEGKSHIEATNRAKKIDYNFDIQQNRINLDNYFTTDYKNKYRNQEVHIYIYLPEGTIVFPNESINKFLTSRESDIDIYYGEEGYVYKVIDKEMVCQSCPDSKKALLDSDEDFKNFSITKDEDNKKVKIRINDKEWNVEVDSNDNINIKTEDN